MRYWIYIALLGVITQTACGPKAKVPGVAASYRIDTARIASDRTSTAGIDTVPAPPPSDTGVLYYTGPTSALADSIVAFAKTLVGIPYQYGGVNPETGFDCSGFINYVYKHFRIPVPRSSIDFTNEGTDVPVADARKGDLVLFTGTNPAEQATGHIGIVTTSGNAGLEFIHSTSGKAYGVTITPLNDYYRTRFIKVIHILP